MTAARLRRTLPPDLDAVDAFCAEVGAWLDAHALSRERFAVLLLLHESLANAVKHGCGTSPHAGTRVWCEVRRGRERIGITVEDDGPGFRARKVRGSVRTTAQHGRGLAIYRLYADRVVFNARGNRVRLSRRIEGG